MSLPDIHFTRQEVRLMQLLGDGLPHHGITELKPLLDDGTMNGGSAVNKAVSRLRLKLLTRGETIVCELRNRRICYRYVKLIMAQTNV